MRLFIAEKPSLGRAIADALPKPLKKGDGFITAANGDTVSWCIGHLLEQAEPESYDPAFKQWRHEHLPIIPEKWLLAPKPKTKKQLGVLRKLVKQASTLIHAGDPDREGQLLVDELINFLNVDASRKANALRCLINDLNSAAVQKAVANLRRNEEFRQLSVSALARSRADWLYGINLTRAYTLQGKQAGYQGVLSVGRVQTPVLGLVVRRDESIEKFVSTPFFELWAQLQTELGETFYAKWQPSESCERFLDEQGRNLSRPLAENVAGRISQQAAQVSNVKQQQQKQAAPLPYSLSALQIDAGKAFGMNAKQVLDICQALYERHKVITYPRSDCRYLPTEHFGQAAAVFQAICGTIETLNQQPLSTLALNFAQKSKAWNDSKVSAHHAIIPTLKKSQSLNHEELKIYGLISRNYLAQFLPAHEYACTEVKVDIQGGLFVARAKQVVTEGWKCIFAKGKKRDDTSPENTAPLPPLKKSQPLLCTDADIREKHTTPPAHFTDATLLAAMTGIASHVTDPEIKKVLKDTDGLGTEATRAGIIELLFKRGFLQRQGKTITATQTGRVFINALPAIATTPDMTAQWEAQLSDIAEGKQRYQQLMTPLEQQLKTMTVESRSVVPTGLSGLGSKKPFQRRRSRAKAKTGARTRKKPAGQSR